MSEKIIKSRISMPIAILVGMGKHALIKQRFVLSKCTLAVYVLLSTSPNRVL